MYAYFCFPGLSARDTFLESVLEGLEVIRVEAVGIVHDQKLFDVIAVVLQDGLIGVDATPLPVQDDNVLRNRVD